MASLTTINTLQNNRERFSWKPMQEFMAYLQTFNTASQVVAISGTVALGDTGAKPAFLNGQPIVLAQDAEMLIASSTAGTETAWATGTAYSVGDVRSNTGNMGTAVRFRCIKAHTSRSTDEPGEGENTDEYWELAPHGATNASGTSITTLYDQWFLVTKSADGTLQIWEAGDEASTGTAECKVPHFDAKMYVPVAFMHIANGSASAFVVGTTSWATGSVTETFVQITGPIFPHADNADTN